MVHTLWTLWFFFFLIVLPWFGHVFSNKGRFGHKRKLPGFFFTISGEKTWPAKHLYAVQHRCLRKECAVIKLTSHHGSDLNHSQFISVSQTTAHPKLFESSRRYFTTMFTLTLVKVPRAHGVQALPLLTTLKLLACRLACTSRLHGEWPQTWKTRISIMMINEYHT